VLLSWIIAQGIGKSLIEPGKPWHAGASQPDKIGKVRWIRLPSVTHSFDENQHINFLQFQAVASGPTFG
jgi:hypothetical protein